MSMVEFHPSFLHSLWIYQRERFPLAANGVMVACLTLGVTTYPYAFAGAIPALGEWLGVWLTVLLTFLLMRLLDEFKDAADDARYRPYRPVPRGLVSLRTIGWLAATVVAVQILIQWIWLPDRLFWLALVYAYLVLMTVEFGASRWLERHPMVYATSHMVIMPLMGLYLTAGWLARLEAIALYALLFMAGFVIEIGRKLRVPAREEHGVVTYSALLGREPATFLWLACAFVSGALAVALLRGADLPVLNIVLAVGFAGCATCGAIYADRVAAGDDKRIEHASGIWCVLLFVSLAVGTYVRILEVSP